MTRTIVPITTCKKCKGKRLKTRKCSCKGKNKKCLICGGNGKIVVVCPSCNGAGTQGSI